MKTDQIFYLDIGLSGVAVLGISIHRTTSLIVNMDFWEIRLNALLFLMEEKVLLSYFYYFPI